MQYGHTEVSTETSPGSGNTAHPPVWTKGGRDIDMHASYNCSARCKVSLFSAL